MTRREASQTSHRFPGAASHGAWAAIAVGLMLAAPASSAGLSFGAPVYYPSGSHPNSVLLADLDRDNDLDAIVSGTSSNIVTLSWNRGGGVFENRVDYPAGVPVYATVGDFDGDSWPDVAVAGWSGSVTILFSPGEGSPTIVNVPVGQNPRSITALDLEGDGDLDLAVTRYSAGTVALLVNTGGVFTLGSEVPARPAKSITAADIDADGKPDLITGSHEGYVTILRQTGAGGFARTDLSAGGVVSMAVAVDLNGDGALDLATANEDNSASVLLNLGAGTFAPRVLYTVGNLAQSLDTGDIDDDGDVDLVVANYSQSTASILRNDGAGAFPQIQAFAAGDRPRDVVARDLNGDGQLDLATSNDVNPGSFAIVLNTALSTEGFLPAVSYPTGMTPYAIALGDLDRDNDLDAIVSCAVARAITVSMNQGDGTFANRVDYPAGLAVHAAVGDFDRDSWPDVAVADWDGTVRVMRFVNGSLVSSSTVSLPGNPRALVAVDLDGDGDLDLAVARHGTPDVALLSNTGGAFTHTGSIPVPQPKSVTAADLDSDGVPEIISGSPQGSVSILKRNAAGSYVVTTLPMGTLVSMVVAADLNTDGHPDLATANESSTASVRLNFGNGTFAPHTNYAIGPLAQSLAVGDVDADGDADLVVASYTAQSVRVLYNVGGVFPSSLDFATEGRSRGLSVGDINRDGAPDLAAANETIPGAFAVLINRQRSFTLTPTAGGPGTLVRIRGSGLAGTSEVWFGETPAMFQVVADTLVETEVPEDAHTGRVRVHTPLEVIHGPVFIVAPMILSFTPTFATVSAAVTLNGYNFSNVDSVKFNGFPSSFTIVSDEEIQAEVPLDATDGPITASNPGGTGTSSTPFSVAPFPLIRSFVPAGGAPSTPVTLRGRFFTDVTLVAFGSDGAAFTVVSDSVVLATVPAEARTGVITVTSPEGTGMSATPFVVAPKVLSFVPLTGRLGDTVTLHGHNFANADTVSFNGIIAPFTIVSDELILTEVPLDALDGPIVVSNPGGTTMSETSFDVVGIPDIRSFVPAGGAPSTPVTLRGRFFTDVTLVAFGSAGAAFTVVSDSVVLATVPAEARTGLIHVTSPEGTGMSATPFVIPPEVLSFAPLTGTLGDTVALHGHNFANADTVSFNGIIAPFTIVSDELILTEVPLDALDGPIVVSNPGGTTMSEASFDVVGIPDIRSFVPAGGAPSTPVTLRGRFFTGVTQVAFGSAGAAFTVVSDSVVLTTVPAEARTGLIHVTSPEGTGMSATPFVIAPEIVHFRPRALVGDTISILGRNFEGTTGVAFAGVSTVFSVVSDSVLIATVPDQATEGLVFVTNPGGTTASSTAFLPAYVPVVTTLDPAAGAPGATVTVRGEHFLETVSVSFLNAPAIFTITSDSTIIATIPDEARTGPVSVATPYASGVSAMTFTVAPWITYHTPSGVPGDTITIIGYNFGGTTQVSFDGAFAYFTVVSDELIETTVPDDVTDGPLLVTNPGGTTASGGSFTVGPHVRGINLSWNECGAAGDSVKTFACDTNAGVDHLVATFVPPRGINRFVGLSADLRIAATSLPDWWKHGAGQCRPGGSLIPEFDVPGEACATAWPGTQAGGFSYELGSYGANTARLRLQAAVSNEEAFALVDGLEYYAFRVRVARAKTTGAGSCAGCLVPVQVRLENIQLFQPADANRDPVLDAPINGVTAYWQGITGVQPQIASITPAAGPPGAGVTILGAGLSAASSVRFGNTEAVFAQVSDSQLSATIPGGARTAPVRVTTPFGSAVGGGDFIVSPEVAFFLPEQGPEGSDVTIFGHNFGTTTAVAFQGLPAAFVIQTDTSIVATVPAGASDGPITVTNPGGATTSFESFRVGPSAGVFNLSWDECGLAGGEIKTFACNTNSGPPFTLVASFAPPANVTEVTGLSADIRVSSPAYPDWWKIGPGACRPGSQLFATGDFATGVACSDFLTVGAYGSAVGYTASYYGPGTARLSILMTYNVPPSATLDPTREYYGFKLNIGRQRTVSDGACDHCDRPVALALEQIRIHRAGGAEDVAITSTFRRSAALWQGTPQPPPDLISFSPPGGDVGAQVDLHGVRFAGVTSVRFGAVEAEFTINSDALITTLVPEGTTSAPIEVVSIFGSDVSDRSFVFAPDIRDVAADPSSEETRARNEIPEVLALDRVAWDAGASALAVTVALPRTGPASFEMFDVSGRRLAGQRLDGLGAGTHELSLRPSVPLRPGVHFVRLTLNRETVSRRFVVVQ